MRRACARIPVASHCSQKVGPHARAARLWGARMRAGRRVGCAAGWRTGGWPSAAGPGKHQAECRDEVARGHALCEASA